MGPDAAAEVEAGQDEDRHAAPGTITAITATTAPSGPRSQFPRKTERFGMFGPGKSWLRVRPGRNSSRVSHA